MSEIQPILDTGPPIDQSILETLSKGSLIQHIHGRSGSWNPEDIEALWHCLFSSTLSPDSSEKYLTTACNCISVFLLAAASSPVSDTKQFATSEKVWFEGFDCAQKALDGGKTKPALQVLETLAQLLKEHPDNAVALSVLQQCSQRLLKTLLTGTPGSQIKSVCIALTCLVKKTPLLDTLEHEIAESLDQVSSSWEHYQSRNGVILGHCPDRQYKSRHVFLALLFAIRNLETRSAALKLFSLLLHSEDWAKGCRPAQSAAAVIELLFRNDITSIGDFADNIMPVILDNKTRYEMFRDLYKPDKKYSDSALILYLSVLKAGRLKKFLSEDALPSELSEGLGYSAMQTQDPKDHYFSFRLLLRAGSPGVRIHAYDLLATNFGTITIVPEGVLQCLLSSFRYLHDDNDAHERGEIISITRRLLRRLESSRIHLQKNIPRSTQDGDTLEHYRGFLRQLGDFLLLELDPGIAYQRHIFALHTLQLLLKAAPKEWLDSLPFTLSLSSLVTDPFEDVRSLAATLLKNLIELDFDGTPPPFVLELLRDVRRLSVKSCRHDHADASGRLWAHFISRDKVYVAAQITLYNRPLKLNERSRELALHSTLLSLAYGISAVRETMEDLWAGLTGICRETWTMVQTQLCVDSPETETDCTEENGGPKDVLAYSWRALRDSSLLLQSILQICRDDHHTLAQIGWLCMEQLTLLRHRGAFSTVAQTFALCCDQARTSHDPSTRQLNDAWFKAALYEIDNQSTKLTRRSAGLPAMVCAVLSPTDPDAFHNIYLDLKGIATQSIVVSEGHHTDISLPQVHALNCLKDIMTHARFRTSSERYLGEALELAAGCLTSSVWAIRNCGLMLLRACMTRLNPSSCAPPADDLGMNNSDDTRMSPLTVTMNLLQPDPDHPSDSKFRSEIIFAGLDLAKHVGLAHVDNRRLTELIRLQLGSPVWAIRDHAARVLTARVVGQQNLIEVLHDFSLPLNCPENLLHGMLLLHSYILECCRTNGSGESLPAVSEVRAGFITTMTERVKAGCSPYNTAATLEIVNDLIMYDLRAEKNPGCNEATLSSATAAIQRIGTSISFCHSRILLNEVLCLLLGRKHHLEQNQREHEQLVSALVQHPDAARFVLEQIEGLPSTPGLLDLLVKLMIRTHAADVRALAMTSLTVCMESSWDQLSSAQLDSLASVLDTLRPVDRTLWEASLRLEACLITSMIPQDSDITSPQFVLRLSRWIYRITVASRDQLELSTRISAVAALRQCGTRIVLRLDGMGAQDRDEHVLSLLLVIYDQLNDDDEEIRKMAEHTASEILQALGQVRGLSIPVCALAARRSVLGHLVGRFGSGPELPRVALARLVGENGSDTPEIRPSCYLVFRKSVQDKLAQIRASMNDLFAEEKQNLYIDDLDEVDKWSNVLRQCKLPQLDLDWRSAATKWCADGVDVLISILSFGHEAQDESEEEQESLHPLDPTHHSEVLVLSLRIVALAKVMISTEVPGKDISLTEVDRARAVELRQKMRGLRDTVTKMGAHRRVLEALSITPGSEIE